MNSDRGNREWLNDYMSLKQVNPNSPFTVPEGYFNESEQQIVSFIKLNEINNGSSEQGFTVPENYFDELGNNINSRIKIEDALAKESMGLTVPENYFDDLSRQIQSRIIVGEALSEPSEAFTVPHDYFGQLTENILNKTTNLQENKKQEVIKRTGVIRQLLASSAFKYATAACLTLAVGATIFLSQNSNNVVRDHNSSFLHKSLSAIPVNDIQNYLQLNVDPADTRTLIDESKQVNADNLSNNLQDELDTSQ
ncbi:MAG: hypothetical protein JWP78_2379 [Mucilaginibacter sp.]|nr:hypothetical protein [Mucilaginibacter sp.]